MININIDPRFEPDARKAWLDAISKESRIVSFVVKYDKKYDLAKIFMLFSNRQHGVHIMRREDFNMGGNRVIKIFLDKLNSVIDENIPID